MVRALVAIHDCVGEHTSCSARGSEWQWLIREKGFTIQTNLFGTTFYSLVGFHATHVLMGLLGLTLW